MAGRAGSSEMKPGSFFLGGRGRTENKNSKDICCGARVRGRGCYVKTFECLNKARLNRY